MNSTTAKQTFQMLGNETLWEVARRLHELLAEGQLPYAIVGGVAVCLHGYRRNTVDLDVLIRPDDSGSFRKMLESGKFAWNAESKEFRNESGIAVQVVLAAAEEGPGQEARFPDPNDAGAVTIIEGLPVLTLAELIQSKIACGMGNLRRTHKDFADVVELIAIHELDGSFARCLHKSVRKEFRQLVKRVR